MATTQNKHSFDSISLRFDSILDFKDSIRSVLRKSCKMPFVPSLIMRIAQSATLPTPCHSQVPKNGPCQVSCRLVARGIQTVKPSILIINKKHSDIADTSTSVIFDLDVWPWHYGSRCHLLYCTFVPGMMTVSVILILVCEILPSVHFLWSLTFTCDRKRRSRSLSF